MFDENVLRYLNEQAHLRAVALANEGISPPRRVAEAAKVVAPPLVFPLSILAKKLIGGPPSLAYFVELLEMGETVAEFRDLVREYLPEYEANIMAEELDHRALKFGQLFSEKYFPLSDDCLGEETTIGDLLERIPVQPLGFSYESYHAYADFRSGYILALSLIECPWDEDPLGLDEDEEEEGGSGARIPIIETVGALVGESLAALIPSNGWPDAYLHDMTDNTEFDGLGNFADWAHGNTGCFILDTPGESLETGQAMEWSPELVDELTDDWHQSRDLLDRLHRFALSLEQDSKITFMRLLGILLDRKELMIPKEQLALPLS